MNCLATSAIARVVLSLTAAAPLLAFGDGDPARTSSFEKSIRPLLEAKCLRCHGGEARKAGLDLSTTAGMLAGGDSGPAIVRGEPGESLLYEKVLDGEMPPDEKDRLSDVELKAIEEWIETGAATADGPGGDRAADPIGHDVVPIMLRRCTVCHGRNRREGDLDLRARESMLVGGKSGPAIVPGRPDESLLIRKIRDGTMPPRERLVEASVKPIEPGETEAIATWIAAGAPAIDAEPDVATTTPDPLVSDADRDFWAFRPPGPVEIPNVSDPARLRNPIDAFIQQKLEEKGLGLGPEADRLALLRRAHFDLTGLLPGPAEVEAFLADRDPEAYEKMIDRLLASPRYGERWGRHWLDLAGYMESEGKREQDLPRPHAWRYRDYVIRSFRDDEPFDRFLIRQLAGDELADYESAPQITPELYDNLVATGFLRMVPDATWANITGYAPDRIEVVADEIDVLGSAIMGLTLKCARCHTHKFDPIPQRDYYRLVDVFKGAYDEYDWLKPDVREGLGPVSKDFVGGRHLPHVTTEERRAWQAHEDGLDREIAEAKERAPDRVASLEALRLPEPRVQALWDRGEPSPTYIYRRGDPLTTGKRVGPGVPSVLTDGQTPFVVAPPWPGAKKTGRRLAFARWLTRPDHPLTARVRMNQVWRQHFGAGIVATPGNFGRNGSPPSHPELLDWLALEFVREGWSLKAIHRLMMTSATYRQESAVTEDRASIDPDNRLFSRMPLTRLDAEALYDSLLQVGGRLDETPGGPSDGVEVRADGLTTPRSRAGGWRRLVYVQQHRKQVATHLENFDFPQMNPNCVERRDSVVAPQALHLMNNGMVLELAGRFADRVSGLAGDDAGRRIEQVYLIAMGRRPSAEEREIGLEALGRVGLATYCHAILNSAGFSYID